LDLAAVHAIEIREEAFDLSFLLAADECFYTNSVREVVPVVRIDGEVIGGGTPGPVALKLLAAYRSEAHAGW
jgi:branched-subunit amino acid aminotransferase/4-amino-4-deoxychorismate lyase